MQEAQLNLFASQLAQFPSEQAIHFPPDFPKLVRQVAQVVLEPPEQELQFSTLQPPAVQDPPALKSAPVSQIVQEVLEVHFMQLVPQALQEPELR